MDEPQFLRSRHFTGSNFLLVLEDFRLGFLRLFHSPMSAKMPVKQFGHAGLKWEDFELLPHHSETEAQYIFPSFSHAAVEIVSDFSDLE